MSLYHNFSGTLLIIILIFQTTLSFIVHDRNPMVLPNVLLADDNDDFMGSCNFHLSKVRYSFTHNVIYTVYRIKTLVLIFRLSIF